MGLLQTTNPNHQVEVSNGKQTGGSFNCFVRRKQSNCVKSFRKRKLHRWNISSMGYLYMYRKITCFKVYSIRDRNYLFLVGRGPNNSKLGPPVVPFYLFVLLKIDKTEKTNLSAGGPSKGASFSGSRSFGCAFKATKHGSHTADGRNLFCTTQEILEC